MWTYMSRVEPDWLKTTEFDLQRRSPPILVAHLSDFHVEDRRDLARVRRAVAMVREHHPDLIAITGDFFTRYPVLQDEYRAVLKELSAVAPTLAVAGNHDGGIWARQRGGPETTSDLAQLLDGTGIRLLENALDSLVLDGRRIAIYGAGDSWAGLCTPRGADAFGSDTTSTRILLLHNPDARHRFRDVPWELLLAGHTHGGQLLLPFLGTPFAPVADKRCVRGWRREDGRDIVVSSGVGNLHGLRFNIRPEVVLIRI
jgi:hypothetical protein